LYVSSNIGRDKAAIVEFDPATGKEVSIVFEHPEVDTKALWYSRKRKVITHVSYITWKDEKKFFDPVTESLFKTLSKKLPNYEITISDYDRDENLFIVLASNDRSRGCYYLFNSKSNDLTKLAELAPWLKASDLAEQKPISYKSRDGFTIQGYLTLPKGKEPKNLPVIVNPHGGPWSRDIWAFKSEVQFLANRGYAVFQMNFRGSTGYGKKFWEASFKQWGRKMQDDITDGAQWLIKEGIADPKRIAIYGGSYGGYATLAGLTFTPDLYACGIDYVGVSNMFTFMKTIPPYWKPRLETYFQMVGHPEKDRALFEEISPALHTDKIKAPLFIAQGAKDPRVNIEESNQMVAALKKRGIEVPYLVKENEGHGFRNEENRIEFYEKMEAFLDQHLSVKK
jgi:dipeptidyl aminopeptidase/acylaminoacyl peptidase